MSNKKVSNTQNAESSKARRKTHKVARALRPLSIHSQLTRDIIQSINATDTEVFLGYLKQQNYTIGTINIMRESLADIASFLVSSNIEDYRDYLIGNVKPTTANLRIYCANKYLEYMEFQYTIKCVPVSSKKTLEKVISLRDYNRLKDYYISTGNMTMYFAIKTLVSTGVRPSELFKIRYIDITVGYVDIYSKRSKERRIYFSKSLVKELSSYYDIKNMEDPYEGVFKFDIPHLRYELRKGVKCGIKRDVLYPYSFRHLYGKTFLKKSKNLTLLADILGHESLETTRIYTRLTKEEQLEEVNRIVDWG